MIDRWLANDWVLRVLSVLLAIGIWWGVTLSQNPTIKRTVSSVPVTVTNTGANLRVKVAPASVSVQIRGPAAVVDSLKPGAIRVYVSVPYNKPGLYKEKIHADSQAGGTQVVAVSPDTAKVTLTSSSP